MMIQRLIILVKEEFACLFLISCADLKNIVFNIFVNCCCRLNCKLLLYFEFTMAHIEILLIAYDVNYLMLSCFFGSMFFRVLYLLNKKDLKRSQNIMEILCTLWQILVSVNSATSFSIKKT